MSFGAGAGSCRKLKKKLIHAQRPGVARSLPNVFSCAVTTGNFYLIRFKDKSGTHLTHATLHRLRIISKPVMLPLLTYVNGKRRRNLYGRKYRRNDHLLSAALILSAYMVGWTIGSFLYVAMETVSR